MGFLKEEEKEEKIKKQKPPQDQLVKEKTLSLFEKLLQLPVGSSIESPILYHVQASGVFVWDIEKKNSRLLAEIQMNSLK